MKRVLVLFIILLVYSYSAFTNESHEPYSNDSRVAWEMIGYEKASYIVRIEKIPIATMDFEVDKNADRYKVHLTIKANIPPIINNYQIDYHVDISRSFDTFAFEASDSDIFKNRDITMKYSYYGGPLEKIRKTYRKNGSLKKETVILKDGDFPLCEELLFILLLRPISVSGRSHTYNFFYGNDIQRLEATSSTGESGTVIKGRLYQPVDNKNISNFAIYMSEDGYYSPIKAVVTAWFGDVIIETDNIQRTRSNISFDR
jgi:hypothetical protein